MPGVYSPYRKPLISKGVRQVGKTWILKEFGKRCYENTATKTLLISTLMKTKSTNNFLKPQKTLVVFDEVQGCLKVINSLKYFCENAPQYHVSCADFGCLL